MNLPKIQKEKSNADFLTFYHEKLTQSEEIFKVYDIVF